MDTGLLVVHSEEDHENGCTERCKTVSKGAWILNNNMNGVMRAGGEPVEGNEWCIVVGTDERAAEYRGYLAELGREAHVIADDEMMPNCAMITTTHALEQMKGGGRN